MPSFPPPIPPQLLHQVNTAVTANGALTSLPANAVIASIQIRNTTANAVTGGIDIGTTAVSANIVSALAVGANALAVTNTTDILVKWFSATATQALFISAHTAWNSASVEVSVWYYANSSGAYGITSLGGTVTGDLTVTGNLDVDGTAGITENSRNAIRVGSSSLAIGASAGAAMNVASAAWDVYIGTNAGKTTAGGLENVGIGNGAMQFMTTGFHNTAVGQQAMLIETVGTANAGFGTDVMRNVAGMSSSTGIGSDCLKYGKAVGNVAVGAAALSGNSSSIIVGGTATAGDFLQVTFTHASLIPGSPLTVSYTVLVGQTTAQMAVGLAAAISTDPTLSAMLNGATGCAVGAYTNTVVGTNTNVIALTWAGTDLAGPLQPTVGVAVVGAGTETLTLVSGPSGNFGNIAIGLRAMYGTGLSTGANNVCIGGSVGQCITTAASNVFIGPSTGQFHTTGNQNVAIGSGAMGSASTSAASNVCIGSLAGNVLTTSSSNIMIGPSAGLAHNGAAGSNVLIGVSSGAGLTSGSANTFIGPSGTSASVSALQATTGANNISIGNQVALASATANNQLCIGNFIYGTTLSGTGATISTAKIGLGVKAPATELEVVGTVRASVAYQVSTNQVVGARSTGWAAMTGSTDKATVYDTSTVTLAQLAGRMMAVQAALTTHGLFGT